MKVITVVGARPQFIKCAPVSRAIRKVGTEILVNTGQHYDPNMCDVFFQDLELPVPDYNLAVGSGTHGYQTGEMLMKIEEILLAHHPDFVLVYGDTNSTLAGALSAAKLHIPIAHVEAGLRSFNRHMPEEINRVVTDHLSQTLFCPTKTAMKNLALEGITVGAQLVGDVMYDALWDNHHIAERKSTILGQLNLESKGFILATVHRAENTDNAENFDNIMSAFWGLANSGKKIVFPAHPRTQKMIQDRKLKAESCPNLLIIDPVSYLDMLRLESEASTIMTDSGGVQKEAFWLKVPCVTLREQTEWVETVESGWNVLVGTNRDQIIQVVESAKKGIDENWPWKRGEASHSISAILHDPSGHIEIPGQCGRTELCSN